MHVLGAVKPIYETVPGFGEITKFTSLDDRPAHAREYARRIADILGGVGPSWPQAQGVQKSRRSPILLRDTRQHASFGMMRTREGLAQPPDMREVTMARIDD